MIRDRNIVCLASSWFDHPTSKHHIMRLLSEQNHVLWVNYHASRRPQLCRRDARLAWRRLARARHGIQRVHPQLDVLSPLLMPFPESGVARRVNARTLTRQIRRALRRLPTRPLQLWLFTPDAPELIDRLPAECVVYYCVDDFAAFDGFNATLMERLEARTLARSDVVITASTRLYDEHQGRHPNVHLVPHGVDYEHFAIVPDLPEAAIPPVLRRIRRPVFGYMGLVSEWLDLELIRRTAEARPDWSFVFLGDVRCDLGAVARLPNVHLLGGCSYERLPAYCRGFDVGLIPFQMNRLVRAVNPIKLREYLAAGLPVVSTAITEVFRYAPAVHTARTPEEFLAACQRALETRDPDSTRRRQALVREESWRDRLDQLAEIVTASIVARRGRLPTSSPVTLVVQTTVAAQCLG